MKLPWYSNTLINLTQNSCQNECQIIKVSLICKFNIYYSQSQEWNSNYQGQTEEAAFFLEDTSSAKGEEERLLDNENEDKEL